MPIPDKISPPPQPDSEFLPVPANKKQAAGFKILALLWCAFFWYRAYIAFDTGHFSGYNRRGGHIVADGDAAIAMGVFLLAVGAGAIAFFLSKPRSGEIWIAACFIFAVSAVVAASALA